jgi:hypothetical protein
MKVPSVGERLSPEDVERLRAGMALIVKLKAQQKPGGTK